MKIWTEKAQGAGSLLSGAFVVSTFGIWARFVSPMFGTAAQTVGRCLLAAGIMGAAVCMGQSRHHLRGYTRKQYAYMCLLGLLSFGLALLFTLSVTTTKVGNTFSLIYAGSILTSFIVGTFVMREKTTPLKVAAVVVALAGLCMYGSGILALSIGIVTGFGAGICDGLSNSVRKQLRSTDRNVVVMYQYAIAGVLTLPLLFFTSHNIKTVSIWAMVAMVLYAIASLAFGKLLLHGFSHFDVNIGGVILAMQIFFGMLLGFIFFHEVPTTNEFFGSILIFLAVLVAVGGETKVFGLRGKRTNSVAIKADK